MLSYALAIIVAISSLVLFFTAFLMSDLHRQDDFLWSGVGLFYALVLWCCAQNITGAVLLGQAAATALLVSSGWQNLQLRRAIAHPEKVTAADPSKFSLSGSFSGLFKRFKRRSKSVESTADATPAVKMPKVTESEIAIPDTTSPSNTTESATNAVASSPSNTVFSDQSIAQESVTEKMEDSSAQTTVEETKTIKSQDIADSGDRQKSAAKETLSEQSLSTDTKTNKITESQPSESTNSTSNAIANSDSQVESKIETKESATITPESPATDVKPITTVTTEIKSDQSTLDTLETVEVAEVLEALPEDQVGNRDSDQSNIIEVTTTEIDSTNQVNNSEHAQEDGINPDNPKQ
ncbi:MAG: Ycf66 family protein [Cyanobacteria bacterium P01_A01_bin.83]